MLLTSNCRHAPGDILSLHCVKPKQRFCAVTDEIIKACNFTAGTNAMVNVYFDYQLFVIRTHRVGLVSERRTMALTYLFHAFVEVGEDIFHILLLEVTAEICIGENSLEDDIIIAFERAMGVPPTFSG
jgi:hypothetical protein